MKKSILKNVGNDVSLNFRHTNRTPVMGKIINVSKGLVRLRYRKCDGSIEYGTFHPNMLLNVTKLSPRMRGRILNQEILHKERESNQKMKTNTWFKVEDVDWNNILENCLSILVHGKRESLTDEVFDRETCGYSCGHIHSLDDDGFIIESMRHEICFCFEDIDKVMILESE